MATGPVVIGVIGMGEMGASLAARLVRGGACVVTSTSGRSAASVQRAQQAGVECVDEDTVAQAACLLSVVPPAAAMDTARQWSTVLADGGRGPVYMDCNAVSVDTVRRIEACFSGSGVRFVDGCIIGPPGAPESPGPVLYLAGEQPADVSLLLRHGLLARSTQGPVGAASALKMAYAGINKGFTALAAAMILAATRSGAGDALCKEMAASQPHLLAHLSRTLPDMYAKAWRWDFEMRQVSEFAAHDPDVARLYDAMGAFFGQLGRDWAESKEAAASIDAFLQQSRS